MTARITPSMVTNATLTDLNSSLSALERTTDELSSGKTIMQPSDNPYGASRVIDLQSQLDGLSSFENNSHEGIAWENTASGAMLNMNELAQRAREARGGGGRRHRRPVDLNTIATEIEQLTESIKQDANTQYAGQYVFSGTATTTAPYAQGPGDETKGDAKTVSRAVGPGASVTITTNISTVLGNGEAAGAGKLLDTLRTITWGACTAARPKREALGTTDLKNLDGNLGNLSEVQAIAGSATDQSADGAHPQRRPADGDHRGAVRHRGHQHRRRIDPVRQRAGRLPGRAARRREHRPGIAAQLPAVAEQQGDRIMSVTFESIRFGTVEIKPEAVIEFPFGLIGLGGLRYALIDRNPGTGFLWLHAVEDPALALPVVRPEQFFSDFIAGVRRGRRAHHRGRRRRAAVRDRARDAQPAGHHRQPARATT